MTRAALVPLWAAHLGLDARATSLIVGVAGAVSLTAGSAVATLGASALVVAGLAGLGAGWFARALDPRSQPERRAAS